MASLLHPCRQCNHGTMDECWAAAKRLPSGAKRLCLDCHDECLPKEPLRNENIGWSSTAGNPHGARTRGPPSGLRFSHAGRCGRLIRSVPRSRRPGGAGFEPGPEWVQPTPGR